MVKFIGRLLRHLLIPSWFVRRYFTPKILREIENTIGKCELRHRGQICFAVEVALGFMPLWHGQLARQRAFDVFSELRVWDTEDNNGVLIYILWADHDVEIVADRGIHTKVKPEAWENICKSMEQKFKQADFVEGIIDAINAVSALLEEHYPPSGKTINELPNKPVML